MLHATHICAAIVSLGVRNHVLVNNCQPTVEFSNVRLRVESVAQRIDTPVHLLLEVVKGTHPRRALARQRPRDGDRRKFSLAVVCDARRVDALSGAQRTSHVDRRSWYEEVQPTAARIVGRHHPAHEVKLLAPTRVAVGEAVLVLLTHSMGIEWRKRLTLIPRLLDRIVSRTPQLQCLSQNCRAVGNNKTNAKPALLQAIRECLGELTVLLWIQSDQPIHSSPDVLAIRIRRRRVVLTHPVPEVTQSPLLAACGHHTVVFSAQLLCKHQSGVPVSCSLSLHRHTESPSID